MKFNIINKIIYVFLSSNIESPLDRSLAENSISSSDTLVASDTDVFVSFSSNLSDIMKSPSQSKWGRYIQLLFISDFFFIN